MRVSEWRGRGGGFGYPALTSTILKDYISLTGEELRWPFIELDALIMLDREFERVLVPPEKAAPKPGKTKPPKRRR